MARFIQITDTHIMPPGELCYGVIDTAAALRRAVDCVLRQIERIGPVDAVLITGDLTEMGDAPSYTHFHGLIAPLSDLGLPVLAVPGNHDGREAMRAAFGGADWMPQSGPVNIARDFGAVRVIMLDSLREGEHGGALLPETLDFLDRALAGAAGRPVLAAIHHHPFASGIAGMDAIALDAPEALLDRLAAHDGPLRLVCGHVHRAVATVARGVFCQICPGTSHAVTLDLRPDAPLTSMLEPGAIMLHQVDAGGIVSHLLPVDEAAGPYGAED